MNVQRDFSNGKTESKWFPSVSTNFGSKLLLCLPVAGGDGFMYLKKKLL